MDSTSRAAFLALYVPLVIFSLISSFLYARGVLLPALRRGEFSFRHHGLAVCIVLALGMDGVEGLYYGYGRLFPEAQAALYSSFVPLTAMRLSVMATSVVAIATYFQIVHDDCKIGKIIWWMIALWTATFAYLVLGHG